MKGNRLPIVLASAFASLAIVAAASYFGFAALRAQDNNMAQHELPKYAEARPMSFQPAPTSANLMTSRTCSKRLTWSLRA